MESYEKYVNPVPMQTEENQLADLPMLPLANINQSQLISDEEYFKNIPVGYRFHPSDEELTEYLMKKVYNKPLPRNRIHEVNLYDFNPEVAEDYTQSEENVWYFFTPRDKKYKNGHRPKRDAGDGYWKATGAKEHITRNTVNISSKRALLYYKGRPPGGTRTCWTMHEYTLSNPPAPVRTSENSMRLDDWVLCRIVKQPVVSKKSETNGNEDEQHAGPGHSRRNLETDNIVDEQAGEEIGQDTTMRIPMEASEELTMPSINQAQLPDIFPYNQPQNVDPSMAFLNPGDDLYSIYQSFYSTPINQQAGMSSEYPNKSVPRMRWKLQHSVQRNYFTGNNCPYIPQSSEISDIISTSQESLASVSGSEDCSHHVSVSHEIPAPASMIQGEYPSGQYPAPILREKAQYSLSKKIPGPISWQQEVDSLIPNPAPPHHEFSGPTFQGQREGPLPQIQAPDPAQAPFPVPGSLEEEFPELMGQGINEGWDLNFLSDICGEAPDQWPQPDRKWQY